MKKPESHWREKLSLEQYKILRLKGTEVPGTGKLLYNKGRGTYMCGACGNELFKSESKFDSGTGWPSFFNPLKKRNIKLEKDFSMLIPRTEVICAKCGSHLGHVFDEEKTKKCPTGKRYCINSLALTFRESKNK